MALPDLDGFVEDDNHDDALSPAPGLLVDGNNVVALTTVGCLADGVEASPALAALIGPPADLSDSSGDDDASGTGTGGVDGTPDGNGTTGNNGALGSPANESAAPLALTTAPTTFLGSNAPPALTPALSPLADANGLSEGHNAMDEGVSGNIDAPINDGATGHCIPGLMANGGVNPPASPAGPNGSVTRSNAPLEFSVDVGLLVNKHGLLEVSDATDAGSGGNNDAPMQLSATLYPLFYCGNAEMERRLDVAVWGMRTAVGKPSSGSSGCVASEC
jgi:hypothetical protein